MITVFNKKEDCCGCTACKSICPTQAITMKVDEEGFLYPKIDQELCVDCGLCRKVCVFQNGYDTSNSFARPKVYAVKHKSDKVRKNSSSGGAFTAISDCVLSKAGIIYGATYNEELRVIHQCAETAEGRNKFRGSKYVQSDLKEVFSQINENLKNDRYVLFTGTGCQVAGLNSYLGQLKVDIENLLTVDIVCHGTPSPRIFADYISYLEKKNRSKIKQYYFRSKVNGWGHTEEAVFESGKHDHTSVLSQTHKELFYSDLCLCPSCYRCKFSNLHRPSDIMIGDFWGIKKSLPELDDDKGVSLVFINTTKGQDIFEKIKDKIDFVQSNTKDCLQHNLQQPTKMPTNREQFWDDYYKFGFVYIAKKYAGYSFKGRAKRFTVNILKQFGLLDTVKKLLR